MVSMIRASASIMQPPIRYSRIMISMMTARGRSKAEIQFAMSKGIRVTARK